MKVSKFFGRKVLDNKAIEVDKVFDPINRMEIG
jgi:hypothetical protein